MDKDVNLNEAKKLFPKGEESQATRGQPGHVCHIGNSSAHPLILHLLRLHLGPIPRQRGPGGRSSVGSSTEGRGLKGMPLGTQG